MTSNRYVVLNCPTLMGNRLCYGKVMKQCADCNDCVIKQVIDICKYCYDEVDKENDGFYSILQLFDIEEIVTGVQLNED